MERTSRYVIVPHDSSNYRQDVESEKLTDLLVDGYDIISAISGTNGVHYVLVKSVAAPTDAQQDETPTRAGQDNKGSNNEDGNRPVPTIDSIDDDEPLNLDDIPF